MPLDPAEHRELPAAVALVTSEVALDQARGRDHVVTEEQQQRRRRRRYPRVPRLSRTAVRDLHDADSGRQRRDLLVLAVDDHDDPEALNRLCRERLQGPVQGLPPVTSRDDDGQRRRVDAQRASFR